MRAIDGIAKDQIEQHGRGERRAIAGPPGP
jgi:hypothetical protein